MLAGTAYGYTTLGSLDDVARSDVLGPGHDAKPGERQADGATDILLVGRDSRTDQYGKPLSADLLRELRVGPNGDDLTDTLIVLRIPNGTTEVHAFSIPRDSYVKLPSGMDKINSAFGRGKAAEAKRLRAAGETDQAKIDQDSLTAGRRATREAVEDLTGVTIDHYAEVNLLSFAEISKAVGGVDVCLVKDTKDRNSGADFTAGHHTISGADALAFVRQRDNLPRGDLDRERRQQVFLAAIAHKVLSAGTLTDPGEVSSMIDAVKRSVVLDASWNLLDFASQLRGLAGGGLKFDTVPVVNIDYRYDPRHPTWTAVQVDPAQVKAFAASEIGAAAPGTSPSTPAPPSTSSTSDTATVSVANAGPRAGLAARVAGALRDKGFDAQENGNAAARRTSLVRFPASLADRGKAVAKALGGLDTQVSSSVAAGHIEVVLGSVYSGPGAAGGGGEGSSGPPPITGEGDTCVN